jgi:hypothetical protein
MVTAAYALGLMDMRDPVDVEIFADEIDAKVAARVFNWAYLSGARSAVVERDPRGGFIKMRPWATWPPKRTSIRDLAMSHSCQTQTFC